MCTDKDVHKSGDKSRLELEPENNSQTTSGTRKIYSYWKTTLNSNKIIKIIIID